MLKVGGERAVTSNFMFTYMLTLKVLVTTEVKTHFTLLSSEMNLDLRIFFFFLPHLAASRILVP